MENEQVQSEKEILYSNSSSSNPIRGMGRQRAEANSQRVTQNRLYGGYARSAKVGALSDYREVILNLQKVLSSDVSVAHTLISIHNVLVNYLGCVFTAFGTFHEQSKCINMRVTDRIGGAYSKRIFLSEESNPIIECFKKKEPILSENIEFLGLPYLRNMNVGILPLISIRDCIGVCIVSDSDVDKNLEFYQLLSSHLALYVHNSSLIEKASGNANIDALTSLYNHREFQEILSSELQKANREGSKLSVVMMDINNISRINRELGHAKGDEVIKTVAEKIKQNIRGEDTAARYGGDEIAIVLPNTDTSEAKYIAEFLTYSLSCCFVDDVGPVKVSVGIATYPDCSIDQEKLLIHAEQAMYISQAKGYKDGMSAIVSSADYNFWDGAALNSFAEVVSKRHSQLGVNLEEELISKFNNEKIISQNHLMDMAQALAGAIDAKDTYTKGHSTSVSRYAEALATAINLPQADVERIKLGALLHDVGKIGIPEDVLKKPTHLSDDEWNIMKQHPVIGAEKVIMPNEALRDLAPMVKYHHEHYDGSGYPEGLKGDEIPLFARIVAVADCFHALISDRPYRKGMTVDKACEILQMGSGTQWDGELVRHFIQIAPSLSTKI